MKAMSNTLWLVISAIIIIIVGIVVLTIFGSSMGSISSVTDFKNNCITQAKATCASSGFLPLSWNRAVKVNNKDIKCSDIVQIPGATDDNPCGDWAVKKSTP